MNRLISVAPMIDYSDRHARYFWRLISPHALLYTEMITANALFYGDPPHLLDFDAFEHPVALQLGGSDPDKLAYAAKLGGEWGYDEINLNIGCPSPRVQSGQFGACLMLNPDLVAECIRAMREVVKIPVTVKCRIGVDHHDSYEALQQFVDTVSHAGCKIFIIHARKAWLNGLKLSPKQNREIPPLRYDIVYQLKQDFPALTFILNGGIKTITDIAAHFEQGIEGVMVGREILSNPYKLAEIEKCFFNSKEEEILSREAVFERYSIYAKEQLSNGVGISHLIRPLFGLFYGESNARAWRRFLSENSAQKISNLFMLGHLSEGS